MKMKNLLKTIVFLCILVLLINYISGILKAKWIKGTSETYMAEQLYDLEDNSVDVCILGSSQVIYGVSTMRMLDKYGISAFGTGTGAQPMLCSYFYLKELYESQGFSTAILDVGMLYRVEEDARFRKTIDTAPLSRNKLDLIWEYRKDTDFEDKWENIFSIYQYHTRWTELSQDDFDYKNYEPSIIRGSILGEKVETNLFYEDILTDNDKINSKLTMVESQKKYFEWIIEYCKKNNINLVLIKTPKKSWNKTKQVSVQELAEQYGLDYLDFNSKELMDAADIDVSSDFYDDSHLNVRGSAKITDYLCEYLLDRYEFRDARKDPNYDEAEMDAFKKDYEDKWLMTERNAVELLKLLQNSDYEVAIQSSGDIQAGLNDDLIKAFEDLGIDIADVKNNYVAYIKEGNCEYENTSEEPIEYIGSFSDGTKYKLLSDVTDSKNTPKMSVNGDELEFKKRGIHLIVYRSDTSKVIKDVTIYLDETGAVRLQ